MYMWGFSYDGGLHARIFYCMVAVIIIVNLIVRVLQLESDS